VLVLLSSSELIILCIAQAADDEIQIFVPGVSKRESTDTSHFSTVTDVIVPTDNLSNSTLCLDATAEVPCSNELHNTSLDAAITPKAGLSSCAEDIGSTMLADEAEAVSAVVVTEDDISQLKSQLLLPATSEDSHDSCAGEVIEQMADVDDEQFVPASEGE